MKDDLMYCLVDPRGHVYVSDGANSFADVAHEFGLAEDDCQRYRFDLGARRLLVDHATPAGALAAQEFVNQRLGSADRLMAFASEGHLSKQAMLALLNPEQRRAYLESCTRIERQFTEACISTRDPCLASGCSVEHENEVCLQPLLRAGADYNKACAAEWVKLFQTVDNRIDAWKN